MLRSLWVEAHYVFGVCLMQQTPLGVFRETSVLFSCLFLYGHVYTVIKERQEGQGCALEHGFKLFLILSQWIQKQVRKMH